MGLVKQIDTKNRTYYFYNDMININIEIYNINIETC